MNEEFNAYIHNTDDPYNFVAFSVDKLSNFTPYLQDAYSTLLNFWQSYSNGIQVAFFIGSLALVAAIIYLIFQAIESIKKHRKIHPHHYAGFGGDEEEKPLPK